MWDRMKGEVKYNGDRNIRRSMPSTSRNSATLRSGMVVPQSPMGDRVLRLFVPATHPSVFKYAVPNTNTNTIPTHPYWTMLSCKYKYKNLHILFRLSIHPLCSETSVCQILCLQNQWLFGIIVHPCHPVDGDDSASLSVLDDDGVGVMVMARMMRVVVMMLMWMVILPPFPNIFQLVPCLK